MLGKIDGISNDFQFRQEYRSLENNPEAKKFVGKKKEGGDSVSLSSGFNYIKSINWQLKDFRKTDKEMVFFSFSNSGFIFSTILDVSNPVNLKSMMFDVQNEKIISDSNKIINVRYSIKSSEINDDRVLKRSNLSNLNTLFERSYSLSAELNISDIQDYQLSFLTDKIFYGLVDELSNIVIGVLNFLEKTLNINFLRTTKNETINEDILKILLIKTISRD